MAKLERFGNLQNIC